MFEFELKELQRRYEDGEIDSKEYFRQERELYEAFEQ